MKSYHAAAIALASLASATTRARLISYYPHTPLSFHGPPDAVTLQQILNAKLSLTDNGDTRKNKCNLQSWLSCSHARA